jgi:asparagine synthase (glutamine-hydrolysing)
MCGIVGITSHNTNNISIGRLKIMTDVLKHRGPNGEGHWISEKQNVGLGHRRLSIIDLSENACQPMHYLNRYTLIYNGEIYNYIELKDTLLKQGYKFQTQSDTEVILALYDFKKEKCVEELDGMFAFALWDNKEQTLFCARDRFGEKPFYYHYTEGKHFSFASEMKALFAIGIEKRINNNLLFNYLSNGNLYNPFDKSETFYEGIKQLEPAHYLVVKNNCIESHKRYWNLNLESTSSISFDYASNRFKELMETSIKKRLRSDVPVGSSLSGGLDSSTIVCVMSSFNLAASGQKTFSASFPGFEKDETKYMKMVAEQTKVSAYFTTPNAETLSNEFDKFFYHHEEPVATSSQYAQWEVMKLAQQNSTIVLLDGQGSDEVLAGYVYYYRTFFQELYVTDKNLFSREYNAYKEWGGNHFIPDWKFKLQAKFPKFYNSYLNMRSGALPHTDIHRDFYDHYKDSSYKPLSFQPLLNQHLNYTLRVNGMFEALLRYGDRSSMAFSREVRLPFLSHELVEFVYSLPSTYKIHNGWTKYILRKSFEGKIPTEITWRKEKVGYEPPHNQWMESTLMKERWNEAVSWLIKEKILDESGIKKNKVWEYLMAYKLFNNG